MRLQRTPSRRKSGASSFSALGAGTASRGHRGFVFDRRFLPLLLSHGRLIAERFNPFKPQGEDLFNMKAELTIDKPARAGRATQIAAMVTTSVVAFMWLYFGSLYLIHDPEEWRVANQQLGYPLYILPLVGVTHILGGVGLLIPNVPRLTEWVYAGFAFTLLLAFYSQLNGGGSTWDKFDPILVTAFVFASYVLRRCMRANKWSI
ncbi:MAG TPA: DoxX family protein [Acidobacteriaceae bacterium]|nr:DoxX family protein [Acidobacteriaceae bacterium]